METIKSVRELVATENIYMANYLHAGTGLIWSTDDPGAFAYSYPFVLGFCLCLVSV